MTARILVDSKEKNEHHIAVADEVMHLADPRNPRRSCDIAFAVKPMETFDPSACIAIGESKTVPDALASWLQKDPEGGSRLDRQLEWVDFLILEGGWPDRAPPNTDPTRWRRNLDSLAKHLARLQVEGLRVFPSPDGPGTASLLRYLASKPDLLHLCIRKAGPATAL